MDTFVDILGFSAGVMVAISILPQIWRAHERRSARDLAYAWKGITAVGVSMQLVYLYHNGKWAVFWPLACELVFIIYLIGLKIYFTPRPLGRWWLGKFEWTDFLCFPSVDDMASAYDSSGNCDSPVDVREDNGGGVGGHGDADDDGGVDAGAYEESTGTSVDSAPAARGTAKEERVYPSITL